MNTDDKKDRLAAALRRNLARRKAQSRARKADGAAMDRRADGDAPGDETEAGEKAAGEEADD